MWCFAYTITAPSPTTSSNLSTSVSAQSSAFSSATTCSSSAPVHLSATTCSSTDLSTCQSRTSSAPYTTEVRRRRHYDLLGVWVCHRDCICYHCRRIPLVGLQFLQRKSRANERLEQHHQHEKCQAPHLWDFGLF